jgi:GT2 family glycosyltransferase/glycosyltransferase involved in cell wall biosynthesis
LEGLTLENGASYSNRSEGRDSYPFTSLLAGVRCDYYADLPPADRRSHNICVVIPHISGSDDISNFGSNLAAALNSTDHAVTCLLQKDPDGEGEKPQWLQLLRQHKVKVAYLPTSEPGRILGTHAQICSYQAFTWLKQHKFDLVHFPERHGIGYYSLLAKRQELCFEDTLFCLSIQGPSAWVKSGYSRYPEDLEDMVVDFLERETLALADVAISPSQYILEWMRTNGWRLPSSTFVQQNPIVPIRMQDKRNDRTADLSNSLVERSQKIDEIIFFESLEKHKGLELFCDVVDQLSAVLRTPVTITFLGKNSRIDGRSSDEYLKERGRNWPLPWRIIDNFDNTQALNYLLVERRLAVIPSLQANSPYAVLTCLTAGVPFVCSAVGAFPEMIAQEDIERVAFEPRTDQLYAKLLKALADGADTARAAVDVTNNRQDWEEWHRIILHETKVRTDIPLGTLASSRLSEHTNKEEFPLVTVCIPHFNRPEYLRQAIDSIVAQDYPKLEVIVVDDGSTDAGVPAALADIESELNSRGWSLLRQEHSSSGAARNLAAKHARGEYLLCMDDDNYAKPHEISTFVKVALKSKADIVTCFMDYFSGADAPELDQEPDYIRTFLGNATTAGLFENVFGDTNALVHRQAYLELGGYGEDNTNRCEDWEFYAKTLLKGARLELIPDSLYWYRLTPGSRSSTLPASVGYSRVLHRYKTAVPSHLQPLIAFAQQSHLRNHELAQRALSLQQQLQRLTGTHGQLQKQHETFCTDVAEKLSTRRNTIAKLESAVSELNNEVWERGKVLDKKRAELQSLKADLASLQTHLQQNNIVIEQKEKEVRESAQEILSFKSQLATLRSSLSWKLTRPLRELKSKVHPL